MRLAVFTSEFPGRVNTFFAQDVRALIDAGVDVEVFAIHPLDPALWTFVPELLSESVLPRTKVHHISMPRALAGAASSARSFALVPEVAAVLSSAAGHGASPTAKSAYVVPKALAWARQHAGRFDHVLSYWGNYAATCAYFFHRAACPNVPFTTFLHAGTDLYRTRVYLEQKLTYADNIVVVCQFNRAFLKTTYPQSFASWDPKIFVHHLGVDLPNLAFTRQGRPSDRIVAVGGLHPGKGFDDLLRATAELRRANRSVFVRIVGGGPEDQHLRALAQHLGIEKAVEFMGWQPPAVAHEEIRHATMLVHPSIGLGDAVPTVIKEAMALGTPVVASAVAGIPELLDDGACGVLTPPRDPQALARAVGALLDAADRRDRIAADARAHAERMFDAKQNGAALADRLRATPRRAEARGPAVAWAGSQGQRP